MDRAELKAKIAYILRFDCWGKAIDFVESEDHITANLDCYALTASAAGEINELSREAHRSCIITIQDINNPKLQIVL